MQYESRTYLDTESTIVARLTAPGGAIAVLRVSGRSALKSVLQLARKAKKPPKPRQLTLVQLFDPLDHSLLDKAMWVYFPKGQSFTGEETVELHLHGNPWIADRVQSILMEQGCAQALPGEFSFRAVQHGKMTLMEAQQLPDLFEARSHAALQRALQPSFAWVDGLRDTLEQILLLTEVELDFSDQGLEETALNDCKKSIKGLKHQLQALFDSYQSGRALQEGRTLVLAGKPNAGKSSLFNALLGFDRALVTPVPGTTRDTVTEALLLRLNGLEGLFRIEDTAGLRDTLDPVEHLGVERSKEALERADLILYVIDGEVYQSNSHEELAPFHALSKGIKKKTILVFNKADKVRDATLGLWVSAKEKKGVTGLIQAILENAHQALPKEPVLTRSVHKEAVGQAIEDLERALKACSLDLVANDLRHARAHLAPLMGGTNSEKLLNQLFSGFCIGK